MKKVLSKIIICFLNLVLTMIEWMVRVLIKISTVVVGLFLNVLLVCMIIAVGTKEWVSLGILLLVAALGMFFVYGSATMLNLTIEARTYIKKWSRY